MATVYYEDSIYLDPYAAASTASNFYGLFSKYDNRFTYTSGDTYVTFDNKFRIDFSNSGYHVYINCVATDGTAILTKDSGLSYATTRRADIYITDYAIWAKFTSDNLYNNGQCSIFIYTKGNTTFWGVGSVQLDSLTDIVNLSGVAPILNYSIQKISQKAISNAVMFSSDCVAVSNGGNYIVFDSLCSCSTVSHLSTISVNSTNYFAIGTNTLIASPTS